MMGLGIGVGLGPFGYSAQPWFNGILALGPTAMWSAEPGWTVDDGSGNVETLLDMTGNGFDATQSIITRRGVLTTRAALGGRNAINMTDNEAYVASDLGSSTNHTVLAVYEHSTSDVLQDVLTLGPDFVLAANASGNGVGTFQGTWLGGMPGIYSSGQGQVCGWRVTGATSVETYRDGKKLGSFVPAAAKSPSTAVIGAYSDQVQQFFDGYLAFLVYFDRVLTDAELAQAHSDLLARYGLSFTPKSVASLVSWTPASQATVSGGKVTQLDDLGSSGNVWIPGAAATQPLYNATDSDFNNKPSIDFDGSDDYLRDGTAFGSDTTQDRSQFVVCKSDTADATQKILLGLKTPTSDCTWTNTTSGGKHGIFDGGTGRDHLSSVPDTAAQMLSWHRNQVGVTCELFEAGVSRGSATYSGQTLGSGAAAIGANSAGGSNFNGKVADHFTYNRLINSNERLALEAWATTEYGV